jgi:hypothetical protein
MALLQVTARHTSFSASRMTWGRSALVGLVQHPLAFYSLQPSSAGIPAA